MVEKPTAQPHKSEIRTDALRRIPAPSLHPVTLHFDDLETAKRFIDYHNAAVLIQARILMVAALLLVPAGGLMDSVIIPEGFGRNLLLRFS